MNGSMERTADSQAAGRLHVRWMIRRDMPEVLAIEDAAFEFPWSEEEFVRCLKARNCIGMVAENEKRVLGFMVYDLSKTRIHLLNLAVVMNCRRQGVGSAMIAKLKSKLSAKRRSRIVAEVRESNLPAQVFFRSLGFRAVAILKNNFEDTSEDAYQMVYKHRPTIDEVVADLLDETAETERRGED